MVCSFECVWRSQHPELIPSFCSQRSIRKPSTVRWKLSNELSNKINSLCQNWVLWFGKCWSGSFRCCSKLCIPNFALEWDETLGFKGSICCNLDLLDSTQFGLAEQPMKECPFNILSHLCSADWSESKPLKVTELFSVLTYQGTCNFCGFMVRSDALCLAGDKHLCLGPLALYFNLYVVMQEVISLKTPTGISPSPAHLSDGLVSNFPQK